MVKILLKSVPRMSLCIRITFYIEQICSSFILRMNNLAAQFYAANIDFVSYFCVI